MSRAPASTSLGAVITAGLAGWLLPGLGHLVCGERRRGWVLLITMAAIFWSGIAIGGIRYTVDPQAKRLWFMAQVCNGAHALGAYGWGAVARGGQDRKLIATSRWDAVEIGVVYTGVAGLLNVLVILDALVRADKRSLLGAAAFSGASTGGGAS